MQAHSESHVVHHREHATHAVVKFPDEPTACSALLAEDHARMLMHIGQLGFFDGGLIPERVYYISAFRVLEEDGLAGVANVLRREVHARASCRGWQKPARQSDTQGSRCAPAGSRPRRTLR